MARDKIERWVTISVGGDDITADLIPGSLSNAGGLTLEEIDMTGESDAINKFVSGRGSSEINAKFHANFAVGGAATILNAAIGTDVAIIIQMGSGAAPTTGDPEWNGTYRLMSNPIAPEGGKLVVSAKFLPAAGNADHAYDTV